MDAMRSLSWWLNEKSHLKYYMVEKTPAILNNLHMMPLHGIKPWTTRLSALHSGMYNGRNATFSYHITSQMM
jgi:hypothetical protein